MYRDGEQTVDDPVGRFALWRVARDIFIGEGKFVDAIAIVDSLATYYDDVDACELKQSTLQNCSAKIDRGDLNEFFEASIRLAKQCSEQSRYEVASDTTNFLLQTFADQLRRSQIDQAKKVRDSAVMEAERYRKFRDAVMTLANAAGGQGDDSVANESPTNEGPTNEGQLNETAGTYLAFVRKDWDEAIHYLAESDVATLKEAANLQLAHQSAGATSMEVADAWNAVAQATDQPEQKDALLEHALQFYEMAYSESEGLEKRKAEKFVADLQEMLPNSVLEATADPASGIDSVMKVIGYRVYNSAISRSDFAKRRGEKITIGMGRRPDGLGEAALGVELSGVKKIDVIGSASHATMIDVDRYSKTGFFVDYHTPGGYTKRVFLGMGLTPGREFGDAPAWGKSGKPEMVTDIGKSDTHQIDLTRWAPPTWDGRTWVTLYMQNAGDSRSIEAELKW